MMNTRSPGKNRWLIWAFWLMPVWAWAGSGADLPEKATSGQPEFSSDASVYALFSSQHAWGFGGGALVAWPVIPEGFIPGPRFKDGLHIEGGLDVGYWSWEQLNSDLNVLLLAPQAGLRYTVYLLDSLAPFLSVKAGLGVPVSGQDIEMDPEFFYRISAGALIDLGDVLSLRIEASAGSWRAVLLAGILFRL